MPAYPEVVSTIALVVSFGSLGVSAFNAFRDRPRLKITSIYWEASDWSPDDVIHVSVVNIGRRTAILRYIGGYDSDGRWSAEGIDSGNGGHRLGEHEGYEFNIDKEKGLVLTPDGPGDEPFAQMFIEDPLVSL